MVGVGGVVGNEVEELEGFRAIVPKAFKDCVD